MFSQKFSPIFLKEKKLLSKNGSDKKTYHLVFDTKPLNLHFQPGDRAAILPNNDPLLVQKTIEAMKATEDELILSPFSKTTLSLKEFLLTQANISRSSAALVQLLLTTQDLSHPIHKIFEDKKALHEYLHAHELWDLLPSYKNLPSPSHICEKLLPLTPRFYSIASSSKMYPDEFHLLVVCVQYETSGHSRLGVTTHFLCDLVEENKTPIAFYLQPSHGFVLPKDPNTDIIMVGPGTGLSPFRSFLQERWMLKSPGKNWLFFGERYRTSDFYYEDFLLDLEKQNFLRLDLAFSRDTKQRVYVQNRLYEHKKDVWKWLQRGSFFYICGSSSMAKDVELTLQKIIQEEGCLSEEESVFYLKDLRLQKRYFKDVY